RDQNRQRAEGRERQAEDASEAGERQDYQGRTPAGAGGEEGSSAKREESRSACRAESCAGCAQHEEVMLERVEQTNRKGDNAGRSVTNSCQYCFYYSSRQQRWPAKTRPNPFSAWMKRRRSSRRLCRLPTDQFPR